MIRAIPDADGWVNTVIIQEVVPGSAAPPVPAGEVALDVDPTAHAPFLYVRDGVLTTPHDDRIAWRRLRHMGQSGLEAAGMARDLRDLGGLPDSGPVVVPSVPGSGIAFEYEDVPHLRLRPFTSDDLDFAAPRAVDAGLQLARCPNAERPCCRPPEAHAWFRLASRIDRADTKQMMLEYRDRPLQMELIEVKDDRAFFTYTMHFTRDRSHWFWRETERPVFEHLKRAGVERIFSRTRNDRPDWIQTLKDNYGAVDAGVWDDKTVRLQFNPDEAIGRMKGWPARRSVNLAGVTEITPAEARPLIEAAWGDRPRKALPLTIAEEWYDLDRATLISLDGHVRALRERKSGEARLATLTPVEEERPDVVDGMRAWCRGVGYQKVTVFAPRSYARSTRGMRAHLERGGFRTVREIQRPDGRYVEITADV